MSRCSPFSTGPPKTEERNVKFATCSRQIRIAFAFSCAIKRCFLGIPKHNVFFFLPNEKYDSRNSWCHNRYSRILRVFRSSTALKILDNNSGRSSSSSKSGEANSSLFFLLCAVLHDRTDYINATYEWINNLLTLLPCWFFFFYLVLIVVYTLISVFLVVIFFSSSKR